MALKISIEELRKHRKARLKIPAAVPASTQAVVTGMNLVRMVVLPDQEAIDFVEMRIRAVEFEHDGKTYRIRKLNFVHKFPGDVRN